MFLGSTTATGEEQFQTRLSRVLNALGVVSAFMVVALMVNQPLRAELTKSVSEESTEQVASSQNSEEVSGTASMQPVSWLDRKSVV